MHFIEARFSEFMWVRWIKRVSDVLVGLQRENTWLFAARCAFIPFLCAGDPNLDTTEKALRMLDEVCSHVRSATLPELKYSSTR